MTLEKYIQEYQLERIFPKHYFDKLQIRELAAGDAICHQGEALTALSYFAKGKLKIVRRLFNGKEHILDIKEKFGMLYWYDNGTPIGCNVSQIIDKYSVLSENICLICGKPDVPMTGTLPSYISPLCKSCYCTPIDYVKGDMTDAELKRFCDDHERDWEEWAEEKSKMSDTYSVRRWVKDKDDYETIEYDISETANKIRKRYR